MLVVIDDTKKLPFYYNTIFEVFNSQKMDLTTTKVVVLLLLGLSKIIFGLAPLVLTR